MGDENRLRLIVGSIRPERVATEAGGAPRWVHAIDVRSVEAPSTVVRLLLGPAEAPALEAPRALAGSAR